MDKIIKLEIVSNQAKRLFDSRISDKRRVFIALAKLSRLNHMASRGDINAYIMLFELLGDMMRIAKFYRKHINLLTKINKAHKPPFKWQPKPQANYDLMVNNSICFQFATLIGLLDIVYVQFEYTKLTGVFKSSTFKGQKENKYMKSIHKVTNRICQLNLNDLPVANLERQKEVMPLALANNLLPQLPIKAVTDYQAAISLVDVNEVQ
ncbi:hypothetical protein [Cysteiniphilum litorale]|uniref:hypothetical protein n=1 Tax=Cysteiniphilum litorale TaxID=2056700 RepID=UPI003F883EE5